MKAIITCPMLCIFLAPFLPVFSQNVSSIEKNRLVDLPFSDYAIGEPHLAVDPTNSDHLLLGAMMFSTKGPGEIICISAVSFDGGKNWKSHRFSGKRMADPWCLLTSEKEAVYSVLSSDTLWTFFSDDGGISWKDSVNHGTRHDHEAMTFMQQKNKPPVVYLLSVQNIKKSNSPSRESVYVASSLNGGRSFDHRINLVQNNLWKNTMTPVVLSDGALLVSYSEYAYRNAENSFVSLTKNNSWTMISSDSGKTFSEPRFITDVGGGFPVLEVDHSQKFRDRLYWITRNEADKQILCLYSVNKGETWSLPVVVSNSSFSKTVPNIAINKDGLVGITWYEKDTVRFCQNFYFAFSKDGGAHFSAPVKISDQISCADSAKNGTALRGGWTSGGHYTGIVSDDIGNFIVVWADARSGRYQLYTTRILYNF